MLEVLAPLCYNSTMSSTTFESIDPSAEPVSTGMVTRPDANNVSQHCNETLPECQIDSAEQTPEQAIDVPETGELEPETIISSTVTSASDWVSQLNLQQNWSLYLSFGSLLLAIIFFAALVIADRKRRRV